jgi:hypothetical protein
MADIPKILPKHFHHKFTSNDISIVKCLIDSNIDPNVFMLDICENFECFMLLIDAGYDLSDTHITGLEKLLSDGMSDWEFEDKKSFFNFIMNDEQLKEKLNLEQNIFYHIETIAGSPQNEENLFQMVFEIWPWFEVSVGDFFSHLNKATILKPYFSFSSKDIVREYIDGHPDVSILDVCEYCDPEDYLIPEVFKIQFSGGYVSAVKHFVEQGFNITIKDFPEIISAKHIPIFRYMKSIGLWNGNEFEWEKFQYRLGIHKYHQIIFCKWMEKNNCPKEFIEKLKQPTKREKPVNNVKTYNEAESDN